MAGRAFLPGSNSLGITACMGFWFHNAGCRIVQDIAHAIDISAGTEAHPIFLRQAWVFGHQVQPFLLATGVTTLTEFEELFQRMQREIQDHTFCGLCFLRQVIAMKRSKDDPPEPFRY